MARTTRCRTLAPARRRGEGERGLCITTAGLVEPSDVMAPDIPVHDSKSPAQIRHSRAPACAHAGAGGRLASSLERERDHPTDDLAPANRHVQHARTAGVEREFADDLEWPFAPLADDDPVGVILV